MLEKGENHKFNYTINIPEGVEYNKTAFSHHAVYFSLDTKNGKYRTQTEPNKLGFMIAKRYNLELTKYQRGTAKVVKGATYRILEEGEQEAITKTTEENGNLTIQDLYVDRTYIVKEVKTPNEYKLNEDEIKFKVKEENEELIVEKLAGTTKKLEIAKESNTIQLEVEDEVRANLHITKIERGTTKVLKGIKYKLKGKGYEEEKILTTNTNGEISVKGIYIGTEYTLEEVKAEGYYLANPIKFIITNNEGNYIENITEGTIKTVTITKENEIPTLNIEVENEPIPTYK